VLCAALLESGETGAKDSPLASSLLNRQPRKKFHPKPVHYAPLEPLEQATLVAPQSFVELVPPKVLLFFCFFFVVTSS
jgi:hypothetical protein